MSCIKTVYNKNYELSELNDSYHENNDWMEIIKLNFGC